MKHIDVRHPSPRQAELGLVRAFPSYRPAAAPRRDPQPAPEPRPRPRKVWRRECQADFGDFAR